MSGFAYPRFILCPTSECLGNLRDTTCIRYLDEVLCYGRTFDEDLPNVITV